MTRNAFLSRPALLPALLLAVSPPAAAKIRSDWSRVQAVEAGRWTVVLLYKNEAPPQNLKIKGCFKSAAAESITLMLPDGQTYAVEKRAVRKVLVRRPLAKRVPGWVALGVTAAILETFVAFAAEAGLPPSVRAQVYAVSSLPVGLAFFYGSRMGGIYNVPPKHRAKTRAAAAAPNGTAP